MTTNASQPVDPRVQIQALPDDLAQWLAERQRLMLAERHNAKSRPMIWAAAWAALIGRGYSQAAAEKALTEADLAGRHPLRGGGQLVCDDPHDAGLPATGRYHEEPGAVNISMQARSALLLFRDILDEELRRIRLTLPQACGIAAVLNYPVLEPHVGVGVGLVYGACSDEFTHAREFGPVPGYDSYGRMYGFDEDQLLAYLATLGPAADAALRLAMARFWQLDGYGSYAEAFAEVGLRLLPVPCDPLCGDPKCPGCHPEAQDSRVNLRLGAARVPAHLIRRPPDEWL